MSDKSLSNAFVLLLLAYYVLVAAGIVGFIFVIVRMVKWMWYF